MKRPEAERERQTDRQTDRDRERKLECEKETKRKRERAVVKRQEAERERERERESPAVLVCGGPTSTLRKYCKLSLRPESRLTAEKRRELVSWCFEPSQPQRITSGLKKKIKGKFPFHTTRLKIRAIAIGKQQSVCSVQLTSFFTIREEGTLPAKKILDRIPDLTD